MLVDLFMISLVAAGCSLFLTFSTYLPYYIIVEMVPKVEEINVFKEFSDGC